VINLTELRAEVMRCLELEKKEFSPGVWPKFTFELKPLLELLDRLEKAEAERDRFAKALENIQFVTTKGTATIFPRDTIETCAARAREALAGSGT
jgi:hypothetical protein